MITGPKPSESQSATPSGSRPRRSETITRKEENKLRKTCARIEALIAEYGVERIVLGFPKHMNNDIGERAEKALEFGTCSHAAPALKSLCGTKG